MRRSQPLKSATSDQQTPAPPAGEIPSSSSLVSFPASPNSNAAAVPARTTSSRWSPLLLSLSLLSSSPGKQQQRENQQTLVASAPISSGQQLSENSSSSRRVQPANRATAPAGDSPSASLRSLLRRGEQASTTTLPPGG
ncbi:hypothetical protein KY285_010557 [Solanum tuberosum]|nr:hypothetical protein KY289_011103 [Solanum tuberosum]KAH0734850.1 hypothetical protein KY285_010557 [Solanum tuberosum]